MTGRRAFACEVVWDADGTVASGTDPLILLLGQMYWLGLSSVLLTMTPETGIAFLKHEATERREMSRTFNKMSALCFVNLLLNIATSYLQLSC